MSSISGGPAEKAGTTYETLWGVRGMLEILLGSAERMQIEEPRVDGAEFWIERNSGREYWQVKRQLLSQATWTLNALASEGVLAAFLEQLRKGYRCVFASITDAPELRTLAERARDAANTAPSNETGCEEFLTRFVVEKKWRVQFDELRNRWGGPSEEDAFSWLSRIEVRSADDYTLSQDLCRMLEARFSGPGVTTMACLRTFYQDSVHQILTVESIQRYIEACDIRPRSFPIEAGVIDAVKAVTDVYISGQRTKLIGRKIITRAAAKDVIAKIVNSDFGNEIVITGAAGSGKSGCTLEIVEALVQQRVPTLAFRLDRLEPVPTTTALGAALDLPESPILVLTRAFPGRKVALVVDQLDIVSTTSGRHPDFFDTVAALIGEVRGLRGEAEIHLILVCRQFDFEHDARFRGLLPRNKDPVVLGELAEAEVRSVLTEEGGNATTLTSRQLKLLQLPQNLALFVDSGLVHTTHANFVSQKELFDAYWHAKRTMLSMAWPAEAQQWMPIIETLVSEMNEGQEVSVPKTRLDAFSPRFLNIMVSEGVLTFDQRRFGFGHESFFDYCFARTFANGRQGLPDFLEADAQHLFRRAQTRQVLVYLRDDDRDRYLRNVAALLGSNRIRAHLKLLILELIAAFPDPGDGEWAILLPLVQSELDCLRRGVPNTDKIAARTFEVFRASRTLFRVADRLGYLALWLHSGEPTLENVMVTYLRWQSREHGHRVAELIEPFVGRGGEWTGRLRYMMEVHDLGKSRRYFELFLRLLDEGTLDEARDRFASNGTFWSMLHGLSEEQPEWCAEVAARWLDRQIVKAFSSRIDGHRARIELDDEFGVEDLFESARNAPLAFLQHVLPAVLRAVEATAHLEQGEFPGDPIWSFRITGEHISLAEAYLGSCEAAFEILGESNRNSLRSFIAMLRASRTQTANSLLLRAYMEGGDLFAEEAMMLLCAEPARLRCGYADSAHWISKCLIENLSPHCSIKTFKSLEVVLIDYRTPYELSELGASASGQASFTLLSALATKRRSKRTKERLTQLRAKFGKPDTAPRGIRSSWIGSPVSEQAAKEMSDDEWLATIAKFRGVGRNWEHPASGGEEELAAMLQGFVRSEPERFARLVLRFPSDLNPCYWMNILYGLEDAPISTDLKLEVVRRVFESRDNACLNAATSVLGKISTRFLPPDAIAFLSSLATDHLDPARELWRAEKEGGVAYFNGDILTSGMNSVRGHAAEAIRDLLFRDRRYLQAFLPALEHLVRDQNVSVRACAASTLLGVASHDEGLAISLFQSLTDTDDALLATRYAEDFVRRGLRKYLPQMRPHVERMVRSEGADVRQAGARLACLARLYHLEAEDLATVALNGVLDLRLGVAEVAEQNLTHPECRGWCEQTLLILFNDTEAAVRKKAAHCFWHLWKHPEISLAKFGNLITQFLKSPAFADDPSYLLHALKDSTHKLPEVVLDVCEHFVERCSEQARDIRTHRAGDEHTVGPLVFRAYQQLASDPAQLRALRLIDRMCEEGLHSAAENLSDFER